MIWALERAFSHIFFCSEKEQKKDAASNAKHSRLQIKY